MTQIVHVPVPVEALRYIASAIKHYYPEDEQPEDAQFWAELFLRADEGARKEAG